MPTQTAQRSFAVSFAIVATAVFLAQLDLFIVNIAFPAIQAAFAPATISDVSWVLSAYAIVFAALLVPAGKLGDVLGRRVVFVGGITIFGLGSALCAVAPSLPVLITARVIQAVGAAAVTPTSLGLVLPLVKPERRPVVIGGWAAIGAVGAATGPVIGGLLTEVSWHWIFLINIPVALVAAILGARMLTEFRDPERPRMPDALGTILLTAAVALVTLGLVKGPEWQWNSAAISIFAMSAALSVAFVVRSRQHAAPVLELSILRVPAFALATLSGALFFAAFSAMLISNVIFLTDVWHYSPITAGLALTPGPLAAAVCAPVSARLVRRFGPGLVGGGGALMFGAGVLLWLGLVGLQPNFLAGLLPGALIGGAGVGLVLPAFTVAATSTLSPARLATGIGAQTMFRQIGATIGVAAFVAILGTPAPNEVLHAFNLTRVFMLASAVAAACALLFISRPASVRSNL
ncbi:MFS transporter [Nocardia sp. NPDC052278]|uniref:MFS transporter n=1 Tax=unclassified Nocardia TaxID=2637762 RepID=UPI0036C8AD3E